MKKWLAVVIATGAWIGWSAPAQAQTSGAQPAASKEQTATKDKDSYTITPSDVEMLRKDIRSQKKQLIAQNLKLTDAEATKFWPLYDQYTAELVKLNDKKYAVIQEYAARFGTLTDEQALSLDRQWREVDIAAAQLRGKYVPIFAQAIGGKKAATFGQIDRRIALMIELQLASHIPLVQSQDQVKDQSKSETQTQNK